MLKFLDIDVVSEGKISKEGIYGSCDYSESIRTAIPFNQIEYIQLVEKDLIAVFCKNGMTFHFRPTADFDAFMAYINKHN